ncbi:hypothetical protein NE237_026780 [Protea cynaroides]|uniref:Protein kinase domain-containing protein n=1 Tax=Protea cynaroides TaxID=273540 RepID=A0A9Q0GLP4_9MAGN|nr:hypothetical protein NE237_026780 [Protea cynaroides]
MKKLRMAIDIKDVRREVVIMYSLPDHPNIIRFRATYEDNKAVHFIMELCEGGQLFDKLVARGHYSKRATANVKTPWPPNPEPHPSSLSSPSPPTTSSPPVGHLLEVPVSQPDNRGHVQSRSSSSLVSSAITGYENPCMQPLVSNPSVGSKSSPVDDAFGLLPDSTEHVPLAVLPAPNTWDGNDNYTSGEVWYSRKMENPASLHSSDEENFEFE